MFYDQIAIVDSDTLFGAIFIETTVCPRPPCEGACEFCPGECEQTSLSFLDFGTRTMRDMGYVEVKDHYKYIQGRMERKKYWWHMNELKKKEERAINEFINEAIDRA